MGRPLPPIKHLKAILFDVDGTLADSDPLHYLAFRDMLQKEGYRGGEPITEQFFSDHISGKVNVDIARFLFPDWEENKQLKWMDDKEALFRRMADKKLEGKAGLSKLSSWIKDHKLHRAAVSNAPRQNVEQMIAAVGLSEFFEHVVIGNECTGAKPFPDPYLKSLDLLGVTADEAFAFEDSKSGVKAAVAANLAVVGVVSGNAASELVEAGAIFTIKDFTDPEIWRALGETVPS